MIVLIITIITAFYWLLRETDYMRVRLLVGIELPVIEYEEPERIDWDDCISRYGTDQLQFATDPICGWDWLKNNTHPIPQLKVSFTSGGVRYNWDIKDLKILKAAITATHTKVKHNGHLKLHKNKLGGLVAPLPAKIK